MCSKKCRLDVLLAHELQEIAHHLIDGRATLERHFAGGQEKLLVQNYGEILPHKLLHIARAWHDWALTRSF
jgi:hypothetical protein